MIKKDTLKGQSVSLFLDGGWKISGEISKSDDDKLFLESDGEIYMVFRSKISAVWINSGEKEVRLEPAKVSGIRSDGMDPGVMAQEARSDENYGDKYGYSIPIDMLTEEAQREHSDNEFSVYFGNSNNANEKTGISFTVEGDNDSKK